MMKVAAWQKIKIYCSLILFQWPYLGNRKAKLLLYKKSFRFIDLFVVLYMCTYIFNQLFFSAHTYYILYTLELVPTRTPTLQHCIRHRHIDTLYRSYTEPKVVYFLLANQASAKHFIIQLSTSYFSPLSNYFRPPSAPITGCRIYLYI